MTKRKESKDNQDKEHKTKLKFFGINPFDKTSYIQYIKDITPFQSKPLPVRDFF